MNPQILSALIAAFASTITAIASIVIGKANSSEPAMKQVYKEQLINLFEPMDKMFSFSEFSSPELLLSDICRLVESHYRLVPKSVLKEIKRLRNISSVSFEDFYQLQVIVASFYNCLKQKLGYPYDRSLIIYEFRPQKDDKRPPIYVLMAIMFTIISGILACVSLLVVMFKLISDNHDISWPKVFIILAIISCIPYVFFLAKSLIDRLRSSK